MLIEDRRNAVLERLYVAYGRRLMRRTFAKVHVLGEWPVHAGPSIAYINHSAWWDAVVPFVLSHDLFRCESYAIMEGAQLAKYPFFRHLGCFGVTGNSVRDARALFAYAEGVLRAGGASDAKQRTRDGHASDRHASGRGVSHRCMNRNNRRTLWVCPQGALLGARVPLVFKSGLARLAFAVPEATVIPVALRFEFRKAQRPECFVRVGEAVARGENDTVRMLTQRFESVLQNELNVLDAALLERPE